MKRFLFSILFISIVQVVIAQTPKTVTDYYKLLPDKMFTLFDNDNAEDAKRNTKLAAFRKKNIVVTDVKNGYLKLEREAGPEGEWNYTCEVALFRKKDNTYMIGFSETYTTSGCEGKLKFLTYNAGKWNDITSEVFTMPSKEELNKYLHDDGSSTYFTLPRKGTTIAIESMMEEKTIIYLAWNGEKFERIN